MRGLALALAMLTAGGAVAEEVSTGTGAVLRVLDKLTGEARDVDLNNGDAAQMGRLQLELAECRYPVGDPAGNAYAFVMVRDIDGVPIFSGWMVAASPALSALDHARYDVWVIRCKTS